MNDSTKNLLILAAAAVAVYFIWKKMNAPVPTSATPDGTATTGTAPATSDQAL